ncbi:MAG: DUF21 domain-containing protein, partial [Clostridia bacterium]|nr:DUF21 domain-containing protein [Clostridia bacterium]
MISTLEYVSIFLLVLVSAFFSATEIAFSSANPVRLKNMLKTKDTLSLRTAIKILDDYDNLLSSILIGNNIANMAASSIATVIVIGWFGGNDDYAWVSTVIMTLIILIFGEIIPKVIA